MRKERAELISGLRKNVAVPGKKFPMIENEILWINSGLFIGACN